MPRKGHSEEQIVFALKQAENGVKVADICRKFGVSRETIGAFLHAQEISVPE